MNSLEVPECVAWKAVLTFREAGEERGVETLLTGLQKKQDLNTSLGCQVTREEGTEHSEKESMRSRCVQVSIWRFGGHVLGGLTDTLGPGRECWVDC